MKGLELRKHITSLMVKSIEEDVAPWRCPWNLGKNSGPPCNCVSHRHYRGINTIILNFYSRFRGYDSRFWGTGASWIKQGYKLAKGERAINVVLFSFIPKKDERGKVVKNKDGEAVRIPILREFPLYNAEQMSPTSLKAMRKANKYLVQTDGKLEPNYDPAEEFIANCGVPITYGGDRACYLPFMGTIECPKRQFFSSIGAFYETVFHELCHHGDKSVPDTKQRTYAFGELVAEIGSCFLMGELNVPMAEQMRSNSQGYIKHWVAKMKDDPMYIFDAASRASKIVDYLMENAAAQKAA